MEPLVSIIIPCKDGEAWLGEAIESCLAQKWTEREIIVVDNGSRDRSVKIAGSFGSSVTRLYCENSGASAARNVGLRCAQGQFIQFLDADDILDRDKIATQIDRLLAAPKNSVASGAWCRFGHSRESAKFKPEPVWRDFSVPADFLVTSWLGGGMMPAFAWLISRELIEQAGLWNESLSVNDDGEFFCRVVLASPGIVFCENARGYYRTTAKPSLSKRRDKAAILSAYRSIKLSCERLLDCERSGLTRKACAANYQRFIYDVYPEFPNLVRKAERRVCELGGSDLKIEAGLYAQRLGKVIGWKMVKRLRRVVDRLL